MGHGARRSGGAEKNIKENIKGLVFYLREFMEVVRFNNATPMVALSSNKDVPLPKGIAVLKILSNAGITRFFVGDPVSSWMEKGKANRWPLDGVRR